MQEWGDRSMLATIALGAAQVSLLILSYDLQEHLSNVCPVMMCYVGGSLHGVLRVGPLVDMLLQHQLLLLVEDFLLSIFQKNW